MTAGDMGKRPSERSFGLTFGAIFAALGAWWLYSGRSNLGAAALALAAVFALVALAYPSVLAHPNRLWFRLGMALNAVVSPIVLGIMFFVLVTPFGVVRRLLGSDPLRLKGGAALPTYWVKREKRPAGEKPFSHQF